MGCEYLIGLEYILNLYNFPHIELADKLGIRKQNINFWVKGRQNIPKKYMPVLEELFGIRGEYFDKELTEIDRLEIQKEKLKKELEPVVMKYEQQVSIDEINDLMEIPIYDREEVNSIERDIDKTKLLMRFKVSMDEGEKNLYMNTYKLVVELMEKAQREVILHSTIEALAHYYQVLPDGVRSGHEQDEYEGELFKLFNDYYPSDC